MTISKKITTVVMLVVMTISAVMTFSVNAGAEVAGSYDISVQSGRQYSQRLYNGGDYIDCKIVSEGNGELTLNVSCEEQLTYVYVYDRYGSSIASSQIRSTYGTASSYYNSLTWDSYMEVYAGTITFSVSKGTYYVRFLRDLYATGSGNITFSATFPTSSYSSSSRGYTVYYDTSEDDTILKYFSIQMPVGVSFKFGIVAEGDLRGTVKWSSSDKSAVKVSSKGKITTLAKGRSLITAQLGYETIELLIDVI